MRLLACFSRAPVVVDPSDTASASSAGRRSASRKSALSAKEPAFVPASIPELHPEYAHAEPYCFAARTDSTRLMVDRVRGARGQPPVVREDAMREEGKVVVRGPSYVPRASGLGGATEEEEEEEGDEEEEKGMGKEMPRKKSFKESNRYKHKLVEKGDNVPRGAIPLQVEMASHSAQQPRFDDSDVTLQDENENVENVPSRKSAGFERKSSRHSKHTSAKNGISTRTAKSKERASRKAKTASKTPKSSPKSKASPKSARTSRLSQVPPPQRTYSSSDQDGDYDSVALHKAMNDAPPALLAPIVAPRMSDTFPARPQQAASPAISNDSWGLNDSGSARYQDVEDEGSSGMVSMSAGGRAKATYKAQYSPIMEEQEVPMVPDDDGVFLSAAASASSSQGLRSKRKSKPFPPTSAAAAVAAYEAHDPGSAPDSVYGSHDRLPPVVGTASALPKATGSRQISAGGMSDDIQVVDTSADALFPIPAPVTKPSSSNQRLRHDELLGPARKSVAGGPAGIMRRASTTNKRKTVSFHEEVPVIIEPNLRAPSRSLPRETTFSSNIPVDTSASETEFKDALDTAHTNPSASLRNVRSSVHLAPTKSSPAPAVEDIPVPRAHREETSDSSGADEAFHGRSAQQRMSRVSIHDRTAVREASQRQSKAVAKAMADQIRGVPRSAMLAFSENEVQYSEDDDSDVSLRRRSRATKSFRAPPVFVPGQIPAPPPPPPFVPDLPRVRSVRQPPPPPPASPDRR